MDWEAITRRLKVAERYVAEGERHVDRARRALESAIAHGLDPTPLEGALRTLELFQEAQTHERDRLRAELKLLMQ